VTHEPKPPEPTPSDTKRPLTDAEFFKVKALPRITQVVNKPDMPDWYYDWLDGDKIKQDFVVWWCGWDALNHFISFETQWRVGFDGRTGLDYTAVLSVLALHYPRRIARLEMFDDIKAIEQGAMFGYYEQRKAAYDKAEAERKNKDKK